MKIRDTSRGFKITYAQTEGGGRNQNAPTALPGNGGVKNRGELDCAIFNGQLDFHVGIQEP